MSRSARRAPLLLATLSLSLYFAFGAAVGAEKAATEHVDEPTGFWRGDTDAPVPASIQGGQVVQLAGLQKLIQSGNALIVDVSTAPRKTGWTRTRCPLAAGAASSAAPSLVDTGCGSGGPRVTPEFDAFLRDRIGAAARGDHDRPVVVYCHKRCWLSWNGAKRLIAYGYRQVYWYPDGIEGWRAAKLPTVQPSRRPCRDP